MELTERQKRRVTARLEAYMEQLDRLPEEPTTQWEYGERRRFDSMLIAAVGVLVDLDVDADALIDDSPALRAGFDRK